MSSECFVPDAEVKQMQDFFQRLNLDVDEVFDGIHVKLVPLQPEAFLGIATKLVEHHL